MRENQRFLNRYLQAMCRPAPAGVWPFMFALRAEFPQRFLNRCSRTCRAVTTEHSGSARSGLTTTSNVCPCESLQDHGGDEHRSGLICLTLYEAVPQQASIKVQLGPVLGEPQGRASSAARSVRREAHVRGTLSSRSGPDCNVEIRSSLN